LVIGVHHNELAAGTEATLTPEAQLRLDGLQEKLHQLQQQEALELATSGGAPSEREAVTAEELPRAVTAQGPGSDEGPDGEEGALPEEHGNARNDAAGWQLTTQSDTGYILSSAGMHLERVPRLLKVYTPCSPWG
jgi:hypothetical protein